MSNSKRDGNGKEKFFVAVTKSCGTAVESSEKAVREEIAQRGVTKKMLLCLDAVSMEQIQAKN